MQCSRTAQRESAREYGAMGQATARPAMRPGARGKTESNLAVGVAEILVYAEGASVGIDLQQIHAVAGIAALGLGAITMRLVNGSQAVQCGL